MLVEASNMEEQGQSKVNINLGEFIYRPKAEMLAVAPKEKTLLIGMPKETRMNENRLSLVPSSVKILVDAGHRVLVESGSGLRANYQDIEFSEAGAEIVFNKEEAFQANIVLKVEPPTVEELDLFNAGQILISPLQLPIISKEFLLKLKEKQVTALAMEYIQARDGSFPFVRILSELAGMNAVITASELLAKTNEGRGVLLGGITGVPPAKVVILGAGVVAEFAIRAALGLGATIRILDNNIHKLMRLQNRMGSVLHTSAIHPAYLKHQLKTADVVIGAIHSKSGRTPMIISEDMVMQMKQGAVIIDVSIDQGGCCETSEVTTLAHPTFVKHGVVHYCVPNMASKYPRTASLALSNIITPILLDMGLQHDLERLLFHNRGLRNGVYCYNGCLTNENLSRQFDLRYTNLDLLLTSQR